MSSENSNNPASKKHGPNNTIEFMIRAINDNDTDKFYSLASSYLNELSNKSHYGTRINNALLDRYKSKPDLPGTKISGNPILTLRKCRIYSLTGGGIVCYFHQWLIIKDRLGNDTAYGLLENCQTGKITQELSHLIVFER